MPEGDVRILGADTHVPRKNLPVVLLVGGAAAAFLLLRGRSQAAAPAGPTVDQTLASNAASQDQTSLEYYMIQQQAAEQIAQITSMNMLQQQQLNEGYMVAAGLNPGLLQQCIPLSQWYNLDAATRSNLTSQVANGQLFQSIGANGICFAPTQAGIAGHAPLVTARSSQGLFSSSSTITGPAGSIGAQPPATGQPGIEGLLNTLLYLLGDAGVVTPAAVPRNPNPIPNYGYPYSTPPFYPSNPGVV